MCIQPQALHSFCTSTLPNEVKSFKLSFSLFCWPVHNQKISLKKKFLSNLKVSQTWPKKKTVRLSLGHLTISLVCVLFQTFCCRSDVVFGIIILLMVQFRRQTDGLLMSLWIHCYTKELMIYLINPSSPWPVAEKRAQIISPPPPCMTVMSHLCYHLCSGLSSSKDLVPELLRFIQMSLLKPNLL